MNDERLLPCPFCGGAASWFQFDEEQDYIPQCSASGCWCTLGAYGTEDEAIAAWNTRSPQTVNIAESKHTIAVWLDPDDPEDYEAAASAIDAHAGV